MSGTTYKVGYGTASGGSAVIVAVDDGPWYAMDQPGPAGEPPPADLLEAVRSWDEWSARFDAVAVGDWPASSVTPADVTFERPLVGDKLLCIGANYDDHIAEMDVPRPPWPYSFIVPPTTTLVLSDAPVTIPRDIQWWDWEAEVAVVLGQRLRYAPVEECLAAVAGYVPLNDLSARDSGATKIAFGIDMVMVKAHDDSKVIAPLLTPAQFVPDPQDLHVTCTVNGVLKQDMHTSTMIFTVAECLSHLSSIMTLEPGDIVTTGTGGGVGILQDPPEALAAGDVVVVAVDGLGSATTVMQAYERELVKA
jgi:2,4-diketo-3-deoxy-L-fuconate hydrolase